MEAFKQNRLTLNIEAEYAHFLDIINDQDNQNLLVRYVTQPCHPGYEDTEELPIVKTLPKGRSRVCLCSPLMNDSELELTVYDIFDETTQTVIKREIKYMGWSVDHNRVKIATIQLLNFNQPQTLLYLSTAYVDPEETKNNSRESRVYMYQEIFQEPLYFDLAWEEHSTCVDHEMDP